MTGNSTSRDWRSVGRYAFFAVLIIAAFATGSLLQPIASSDAQTRFGSVQPSPAPPTFESGSQRSLPVLQEILATLRRMDGRLERLETRMLEAPRN